MHKTFCFSSLLSWLHCGKIRMKNARKNRVRLTMPGLAKGLRDDQTCSRKRLQLLINSDVRYGLYNCVFASHVNLLDEGQ